MMKKKNNMKMVLWKKNSLIIQSRRHGNFIVLIDFIITLFKRKYGILTTFGVRCLGFLCCVFVILLKTYSTFDFKKNIMLKVLIAFAAGTLLGDSFVHIIPENFKYSLKK